MSNTTPTIFTFQDLPVRTFTDEQGEIWFVAKDVCDVLEHTNPTVAVELLDDDERAKKSLGRQGEAWIISESGLYTLIFRSNKPQAKPFRRWVTHEVLPAIRKTGSYTMPSHEYGKQAGRVRALEGEIKEGAALINQIIGKETLSSEETWHLASELVKALFGVEAAQLLGLEDIKRHETNLKAEMTRSSLAGALPMLLLGDEGLFFSMFLEDMFIISCCDKVPGRAVPEDELYRAFCVWFERAFDHPPFHIELFRSAFAKSFRRITLIGKPWYLGLALKKAAALPAGEVRS